MKIWDSTMENMQEVSEKQMKHSYNIPLQNFMASQATNLLLIAIGQMISDYLDSKTTS